MAQSPLHWRRGPRASFLLSRDKGVYALFLRNGAILPGVEPGDDGMLYIGRGAGQKGFKGRCHFGKARTANHSPRKSLAVLLMNELSLTPVLVTKPKGDQTWGLNPASDASLTEWMYANLELGIEICANPHVRETELVCCHAPPLNLNNCMQSAQHKRISDARKEVMASLLGGYTLLSTRSALI